MQSPIVTRIFLIQLKERALERACFLFPQNNRPAKSRKNANSYTDKLYITIHPRKLFPKKHQQCFLFSHKIKSEYLLYIDIAEKTPTVIRTNHI